MVDAETCSMDDRKDVPRCLAVLLIFPVAVDGGGLIRSTCFAYKMSATMAKPVRCAFLPRDVGMTKALRARRTGAEPRRVDGSHGVGVGVGGEGGGSGGLVLVLVLIIELFFLELSKWLLGTICRVGRDSVTC